ncbi:adenosine deaminase [Fodinicola feengrottensis]
MRDLRQLPKAHLHVHLESTVRWSTLAEFGAANGVDVPSHRDGEAMDFADFRQFADYNALVRDCLRRPEDFRRVAREFCEDEAAQGTQYAEVTFTAASHGERLGDLEMPLATVLEGLADGQRLTGLECQVILDHSRRRSVQRCRETLWLAEKYAGVVAIGVAGEESYPLEPFAAVLEDAREAGIHLVHHAGEAEGAGSIREAIDRGHTERLGHGIRVLDDNELVARVRDSQLALEVCSSSNVALGFAKSYADHPLPRLVDAGLTVTLNTDIPNVLGITLTDEFSRVREIFGYDDETLAGFSRAAVDASFAPASTRTRLHQQITSWLAT